MFEAKARYVDKEFLVANLLQASGETVRKSVEVHFELLGEDDTSRVNYKDMVDYIRSEFQREDCLHDLLVEYQSLQQGLQTIRQYLGTIPLGSNLEFTSTGLQ
eukprot:SAG11_NODE_2251_length_3633_cov_15.438031_5_plen_103_part_00